MTSRTWAWIRLGCAASSFPVFAVAVIILGSVTPGYSQWSDPVSRLASPGEPWAPGARAVFAIYGVVIIASAGSLRNCGQRHGHWVSLVLALYGLACVVAGIAPKNQPGTPPTLASQVHVTAAVLAGALLVGAMVLISRCAATIVTRRTATAMAALTGAAAGIFRLTWGTHLYGLSERLLLGLGMGWLSALAASALTSARKQSQLAMDEP